MGKNKVHVSILFLMFCMLGGYGQTVTIPSDSVRGPMCVIIDSAARMAVPLSPHRSTYNIIVTDGLARISLTQLFVNDYGTIKDMVYVFPLPHDAAVHGMAMEYQGKIYKAEIYEKKEAQAKYDSVKQQGGTAALLLQDRPNVFQQRLANIAFHDSAWIQIICTMPLSYDNGTYELAMPTMVSERFQSANASAVNSSGKLWNPPVDRNGQSLQINVLLQTDFPVSSITSPTHPVALSEIDAIRKELESRKVIDKSTKLSMPYNRGVMLQEITTYPNKDFVLRFSRAGAERSVTVASYFDTTLGVGYFYSTLFPDTTKLSGNRQKMDVVLLIDISGSQNGWPLAKEKEIATGILDKLLPTDQITVLSFEDQVTWCFGSSTSVPASGDNVQKARSFINNLATAGGTNLLAGVQSALSTATNKEYARYFVFLTDGNITNESAIIAEIKNHPTAPAIFTFGAGNNLNRYFLDEAAKVGNGMASVVTENESVVPYVNNVWNKIESPQLSDISITCSGFDPAQLLLPYGKSLYRGAAVSIFGVYTSGGKKTVSITGTQDGKQVTISEEIELATLPTANSMIPQVWAKQMISKLRVDEGTGTTNKNHIIELSKQYQVLSDYTAFLAIQPVDVTPENTFRSVGNRDVPAVIGQIANTITIKTFGQQVIIEASASMELDELSIYDLSGRCLFSFAIAKNQQCTRFIWDGLLASGKRIARGQYIFKIRTGKGLVMRTVFIR